MKQKFKSFTKKQILEMIRNKNYAYYYDRAWLDKRFPGKSRLTAKDVMGLRAKYFRVFCDGPCEISGEYFSAKVGAIQLLCPYAFRVAWDNWYDFSIFTSSAMEVQIVRAAMRKYEAGVPAKECFPDDGLLCPL